MDINTLVKITSRAWSLDILALMHAGAAGRQAPLLAATGAGRTAFTKSLAHLVELKLLERNPGHGHPLRPEYRLTPKGSEMARIAGNIAQTVPNNTDYAPLRLTWTIPVLSVTATPRRFNEIKSELFPITDRALSKSLHQLQSLDWVRRDVNTGGRPPHSIYQAKNIGFKICQAVNNHV